MNELNQLSARKRFLMTMGTNRLDYTVKGRVLEHASIGRGGKRRGGHASVQTLSALGNIIRLPPRLVKAQVNGCIKTLLSDCIKTVKITVSKRFHADSY